jgi:beta-lactam-binding protein with PASTA domain
VRGVALVTLIAAFAAGCGGSEPATVVPYVVGLRGPLAEQVTRNTELDVQVRHMSDGEMRQGFVVSQSIREGTQVSEGDTLTIWVSTGPS